MISFNRVFSRDKEGHLRLWWARARLGRHEQGNMGHLEKLQGSWGQRSHEPVLPLGSQSATRDGLHLLRRFLLYPRAYGKIPAASLRFPSQHETPARHFSGFLAAGICHHCWEAQLSRKPRSWPSVHKGWSQGWPGPHGQITAFLSASNRI